MLQVSDLRDTRVYQEALEEGKAEGKAEGEIKGKREQAITAIVNMANRQMLATEIAAILEVDVEFVQQVLKDRTNG